MQSPRPNGQLTPMETACPGVMNMQSKCWCQTFVVFDRPPPALHFQYKHSGLLGALSCELLSPANGANHAEAKATFSIPKIHILQVECLSAMPRIAISPQCAIIESPQPTSTNCFFTSSPDRAQRRPPEEKGPFGRSTRRGRSSTRHRAGATPGTRSKEDVYNDANWRFADEIFNKARKSKKPEEHEAEDSEASATAGGAATLQKSATTTSLEVPTEVILYGYGAAFQWAAIEFYERVSGGNILETYERHAPNLKFDMSLSLNASMRRRRAGGNVSINTTAQSPDGSPAPAASTPTRRLAPEDLRKVNSYHGGTNWIKVTFNSHHAADRACHASPHVLHGYRVYAEIYRGSGPTADEAIPANSPTGNRATTGPPSHTSSPNQNSSSTTTLRSRKNGMYATPTDSDTASSATATGTTTVRLRGEPGSLHAGQEEVDGGTPTGSSTTLNGRAESPMSPKPRSLLPSRRAVLKPASSALLQPQRSRWALLIGSVPVVGRLLVPVASSATGGTSKSDAGGWGAGWIGSEVPRREADGKFDWEKASLYWRFWAYVDWWAGTDFCGLEGDDD